MSEDEFIKFENDHAHKDYFAFVDLLSARTAAEFRSAKGDRVQQKRVLCRYYKFGYRANLTTGELIDFLGVSSPSILDLAGYSDDEGDAVMEISDGLTDDEIESADLA